MYEKLSCYHVHILLTQLRKNSSFRDSSINSEGELSRNRLFGFMLVPNNTLFFLYCAYITVLESRALPQIRFSAKMIGSSSQTKKPEGGSRKQTSIVKKYQNSIRTTTQAPNNLQFVDSWYPSLLTHHIHPYSKNWPSISNETIQNGLANHASCGIKTCNDISPSHDG